MNNDPFIENEIRKLRPAALPADLRDRMREEPVVRQSSRLRRVLPLATAGALATAACVAIVIKLRVRPEPAIHAGSGPPEELTIIEQNSILADSRTIALHEHHGRMWELVEQEWRDDTVALCSTSPVRVRSTVIRPVIVWRPVEFQ